MSDEKRTNAYDQLPYPSLAYSQTHPDRLATLATVLGMKPAPVDRCRVLELGCASGGNLIPMAYALPESKFVGVDASQVQVAEGQRVIEALALDNAKLQHMDILDVDASLGQFDYIIVHELAHLIHSNHSPAFWGEVEKVIPDYRERKEWLRKNGAGMTI